MRKNHCRGGACSTGMYPWGSSLFSTTIFDEGIFERGKEFKQTFFWPTFILSKNRYRVRIWGLKARFGCLRRKMDINLKRPPAVIHSCFILHNLCEIRQDAVNPNDMLVARNYDVEFQPETDTGYEINNNEAAGKRIRKIFFKYFE